MKQQQDSARRVALKALLRCEDSGYSNLVLGDLLEKSALSPRDKAFASRIFYGTLERKLTLDARIKPFLKQPIEKMIPEVRAVLRSGLYQILYMDSVPASAAVNESVALVRALGKSSAAGFVNAVLRRAGTADFAPKFSSETERLSVTYSVGLPIVKLLQQEYPDRAEALLAASFCTPKLAVRVNALKTTPEKLIELLAQQNVTVEKSALPQALFLFGVGDITRLPAFQQGLFHVQGLASQLACAALDVQPGERVLDLCAAPGGKSATIAQQLAGSGSLVACELYESRLPLINTLIARISANNVVTLQNDAAIYREELSGMDKVLCDVPCSGLGTMAKKPDIRYKDLAELPKLLVMQRAILASGARSVKRGGRLVYSTCTINPDENERIVRDFLVKNPDFVLRKLDFSMFECEQIDEMCLFLPQNGRMDGFFIATLERL